MDSHFQSPEQTGRRFNGLMHAGKEALDKGNRRLAHDLWREAATIDPYNEQVWLALFRVLDNDDDRIVCLQNIIAINPLNVKARRRLHAFEMQTAKLTAEMARVFIEQDTKKISQKKLGARQRKNRSRRLIILAVFGLVLGILAAVAVSMVLYGGVL